MSVGENCENCGEAIGRLEKPYVWGNNVVCKACHKKLSEPESRETKSSVRNSTYVDYLFWPRIIASLIAIAVSFANMGNHGENKIGEGIAWAAWISLGIVSIVQKSNWKREQANTAD